MSTHLRRAIWGPLRAAEYVVFVITRSFLENRECTYELGAAASSGIPSIPLLMPDQTFDNAKIPVSDRSGGHINERRTLAGAHATVARTFGHDPVDWGVFDELVDEVIDAAAQVAEREARTPTPNLNFNRSKTKKLPPATTRPRGAATPK